MLTVGEALWHARARTHSLIGRTHRVYREATRPRRIQRERLANMVTEEPAPSPSSTPTPNHKGAKGSGRNRPCPCGSGIKAKRCDGLTNA